MKRLNLGREWKPECSFTITQRVTTDEVNTTKAGAVLQLRAIPSAAHGSLLVHKPRGGCNTSMELESHHWKHASQLDSRMRRVILTETSSRIMFHFVIVKDKFNPCNSKVYNIPYSFLLRKDTSNLIIITGET